MTRPGFGSCVFKSSVFCLKRSLAGFMALFLALAIAPMAHAQKRPYIGYAYPAGGQQATTFHVKLGGQNLDDVNAVLVTGPGVNARVLEYFRRLGNQEVQLLNEQLKELKPTPPTAPAMAPTTAPATAPAMAPATMSGMEADKSVAATGVDEATQSLIDHIGRHVLEAVQSPACASISNLVLIEVTIAPDASPGPRELRLVTARGVSNPLQFHVGQLPESSRKPMIAASLQVLGKEAAALRKRPPEEAEVRITLPCTVNGQMASGELNSYRFHAGKGQRLVIATQARQLIPYLADAVPGWFQPVLALYDSDGKELAYADDYRFHPDPVLLYQVPADGEYVFAIRDGLYRGREDFVYRISAGELPFVTSIFPLGGPVGAAPSPALSGWGLAGAKLDPTPATTRPGIVMLATSNTGFTSNRLPFMLDTLPELLDTEPNDTTATAQKVTLPVIINGRIERPDDWDVFQFTGHANDPLVVDVQARRLDSPLDSVIKLTDADFHAEAQDGVAEVEDALAVLGPVSRRNLIDPALAADDHAGLHQIRQMLHRSRHPDIQQPRDVQPRLSLLHQLIQYEPFVVAADDTQQLPVIWDREVCRWLNWYRITHDFTLLLNNLPVCQQNSIHRRRVICHCSIVTRH